MGTMTPYARIKAHILDRHQRQPARRHFDPGDVASEVGVTPDVAYNIMHTLYGEGFLDHDGSVRENGRGLGSVPLFQFRQEARHGED
jgi:hypothetical protein